MYIAVQAWLGQALDPSGDAILHWRVPLTLCVTEEHVQVQECLQAFHTGSNSYLAQTRDVFPEVGGFNIDVVPSSGELFGPAEPGWSQVDTATCPLAMGVIYHGDAAQGVYSLVTGGPTVGIEKMGLGNVVLTGYLGENLPALFQALMYIQEWSSFNDNVERVVFHQNLIVEVSHTEDQDRCPIVLIPPQSKMIIDSAFRQPLVTGVQETDGAHLAGVVLHSAFHLFTETSPLGPAPTTRPTPSEQDIDRAEGR